MKAALSLEHIGANTHDELAMFQRLEIAYGIRPCQDRQIKIGPWVSEIFKDANGSINRKTLYGKRDYSRANSKGSRGVMVNYVLEENKLYLVRDPRSWKSVDVYYAAVTENGDVKKLTEDEAIEWLKFI